MKALRCVIIDDEEMAVKVIHNHIAQIEGLELVGTFYSAVEAFLDLDKINPDVLFLDIQMPKLTGLSMLKMMKNPPLTILTTAYRDYAFEGYEMDVVDYLLKPISFERFLKSIKKIRRIIQLATPEENSKTESEKDHLFIKANRRFIKIFFKDIRYVEAIRNHVKVVTVEASYLSLIKISSFELELDSPEFIRVHRSFIINTTHINSFDNHHINIASQIIPIGKSYKDTVIDLLKKSI